MSNQFREYSRRRLIKLQSILLGGGLLAASIGAILAEFVYRESLPPIFEPHIRNSIFTGIGTILFSHFTYIKFDRLPGSSPQFLAIPSLILFFFILFAGLLFARLDYSRTILGGGFAGAVIWYTLATLLLRKQEIGKLGIYPGINVENLEKADNLILCQLDAPESIPGDLDAVIIPNSGEIDKKWKYFLSQERIRGLPVYRQSLIEEHLLGSVNVEEIIPSQGAVQILGKNYLVIRFVFDRMAALFLTPIVLLLLIPLAVLIKMDDGGPVLFRQKRTGYMGKTFVIYKLRTMNPNSATQSGLEAAKTKTNDQRITRVGKFLRKTRLDELPQIFNILKGEMAWIGPRPNTITLSDWYRSEFSQYDLRYLVPPGITGWAQVNQGHVATVEGERKKVGYDLYYAKNVSLSLDLLIIIRTIQVVLTGHGAK